MNVPNFLSCLRILLTPVVMLAIAREEHVWAVIFVTAGLSWSDSWRNRRRRQMGINNSIANMASA